MGKGQQSQYPAQTGATLGSPFLNADGLKGRHPQILHTSFVKPSIATPQAKEWLPLSLLDYRSSTGFTPLLCTFPANQVHKFGAASSVVQHLKDSLSEALVLFYPFAGRLLTVGGPGRIHCNDAGAVFTEASVELDMAEIGAEDFRPVPLLSGLAAAGLAHYPALPQIAAGIPILIVQVTHFQCGGITLAANWSHRVADGQSGLHFMKSWSEIARGLPVSLLPDHRRELVKPRDPLVPVDIAEGVTFSPGSRVAASLSNDPSTPCPATPRETTASSNSSPKLKQIASQVVEFTKDEVAQLRNPNPNLSRADCFSAHLWRTIIRARGLPSDALVRLWVLIEGRQKFSLPAGYFGNVRGMTPIVSTVKEVLEEPLGVTAALIHSAIAAVSEDWFQGMVDHLASRKERESLFSPDGVCVEPMCTLSYQVRFPFYELDFGFGRPQLSTRNTMGALDGLVFIVPSSHGEGHMVAMANLEPAAATDFAALAHDLRN